MPLRLLLSFLFCVAAFPASSQRPLYGKMSPMLRALAAEEWRAADASRTYSGDMLQNSIFARSSYKEVCAFVKVDDNGDEVLLEHGCKVLASLGKIRIASIPLCQLGALSLDEHILRMEASQGTKLQTDSMALLINALPAYSGAGLPQAFTGKDVVVGVMDVGFDLTHPTFYSRDTTAYRIRRFWDMLSTDTVGSNLYVGRDYEGREALLNVAHSRDGNDLTHGTLTASIAAGSGYNSNYRGVAPDADICLVSNAVTDDAVFIDSADYYKYTFATDALGFKYLFDYAKSVGKPCVASFSEGSMQDFWGYDQLYYEMLGNLVGPGRIIVSSAGNNGYLKSWFRKSAGEYSMGSFIQAANNQMMLTFKSADNFLMRIVHYGISKNDTILVSTADVLSCPDSLLTVLGNYGSNDAVHVLVEAYPSCYVPEEMCYDVTLTSTLPPLGADGRMLSAEVVGIDADVSFYRVNGYLLTSSLNPLLDAGENTYSILSPSSAECVISVGASSYRNGILNKDGKWKRYWLGENGVRVPFSSMGPTYDGRIKPDVMAPGNNIVSAYNSYYIEHHPQAGDIDWDVEHFSFNGRTYAWNSSSGTSMSCPAVAGAIALWLQAKPELTPEDVKDVLSRTCRHYDESLTYPNNEYGYGEIDVYRGLLYILGLDGITDVSHHHTSASIDCADGRVVVSFSQSLPVAVRLKLYNINGRLVKTAVVKSGQTSHSLSLENLPRGIYAVQLDGHPSVQGSTLIRH